MNGLSSRTATDPALGELADPCWAARPRVPERYVGVWRRLSLREDGARWDQTSRVFWLQTHHLYADLRIPVPRPDFSTKSCLADCTPEDLRWLATQQGFAGEIAAEGDFLRWDHDLDYQGPAGRQDLGQMHMSHGILLEEGVLSDYTEEWQRIGEPSDDSVALRLRCESAGGQLQARVGYLLVLGDYFMLALDRRTLLPGGASLRARVAERPRAEAERLLDLEISFGLRHGGHLPWEILFSTLPFKEGRSVFHADEWSEARADNMYLQRVGACTRYWSCVELGSRFQGF